MFFILLLVITLILGFITLKLSNTKTKLAGMVLGVIAGIFLLLTVFQFVSVVPAGHVGIVDFFGSVADQSLQPGLNIVNPMAHVEKMSTKTQELKQVATVPSREGLTVTLEVSVLFHLDPSKAPEVYKSIGPNYVAVILLPQLRSVIRSVTAGYDAKALYTSERQKLALEINTQLAELVSDRGVAVERTPLRDVKLPSKLTASIEEKLRAEQESQRMQFILTKEKQEADRKRIEAKGIADFQKIVSKGISDNLLKWKGIEATEKLSNSQNAKVVVIGAGKSGLPLILNQ